MATRKPRKREYIPPVHEVVNKKDAVRTKRPAPAVSRRSPDWRPPEPTWRRTLRRVPVYFVLLFGLNWFMMSGAKTDYTRNEIVTQSLLTAALYAVLFIPILYWMERWTYSKSIKRIERDSVAKER